MFFVVEMINEKDRFICLLDFYIVFYVLFKLKLISHDK